MRTLGLALVAAALVITAGPASGQGASGQGQYQQGQTVTGTWDVTFILPAGSSICPSGPNDCPVPALATATSDGTLIQTAAIPDISEGHGVWIRTGLRTFSLRSKYFRYDATGVLIGSSEASTIVTLAANGITGSGTYEIQPFDLNNQPLTAFSGTAVFQRIVP
jgi:hypothetical protein